MKATVQKHRRFFPKQPRQAGAGGERRWPYTCYFSANTILGAGKPHCRLCPKGRLQWDEASPSGQRAGPGPKRVHNAQRDWGAGIKQGNAGQQAVAKGRRGKLCTLGRRAAKEPLGTGQARPPLHTRPKSVTILPYVLTCVPGNVRSPHNLSSLLGSPRFNGGITSNSTRTADVKWHIAGKKDTRSQQAWVFEGRKHDLVCSIFTRPNRPPVNEHCTTDLTTFFNTEHAKSSVCVSATLAPYYKVQQAPAPSSARSSEGRYSTTLWLK